MKETPRPANTIQREIKIIPLFPSRLRSTKCEREDQNIIDNFRKVDINVHIIYAIKQV